MSVEDRSVFELPAPEPDETIHYGDLSDQIIDHFKGSNRKIALIHGGYWRPEYNREHIRNFAKALSQKGFDIYSIEYRRIPGSPDLMVEDIKNAIAKIGDCVVVGHSAGGHLALLSQQLSKSVKKVIALAAISNLQETLDKNLDDGSAPLFLGNFSPDSFDPLKFKELSCETILIHGDLDIRVPISFSQEFSMKFKCKFYELKNVGHFELIDQRQPVFNIILDELKS